MQDVGEEKQEQIQLNSGAIPYSYMLTLVLFLNVPGVNTDTRDLRITPHLKDPLFCHNAEHQANESLGSIFRLWYSATGI